MKDKTFLVVKKCLMDQIKATEQIIAEINEKSFEENKTDGGDSGDSLVSMKEKLKEDLRNLVDAYNEILDFEWIGI